MTRTDTVQWNVVAIKEKSNQGIFTTNLSIYLLTRWDCMVLRGRRKKAQFMALRRLVKAFPVHMQSMDGGGKTNSSFVIVVVVICAILAFVLLSLQVDGWRINQRGNTMTILWGKCIIILHQSCNKPHLLTNMGIVSILFVPGLFPGLSSSSWSTHNLYSVHCASPEREKNSKSCDGKMHKERCLLLPVPSFAAVSLHRRRKCNPIPTIWDKQWDKLYYYLSRLALYYYYCCH